ncbi:hypothetical protein BRYFOR_05157 [Marvinbryantia formatexigens DSM 14469]|uniref:Uncharacterized protein n=1 Tax=Marvinbryantia formatexigens DSM 14469 TaxID=478749 RepID=C6L967_9FIRM|nr:hypothetical protein BRYFOR_05157 [Marvinbryantia formatexigens DSM 14469]
MTRRRNFYNYFYIPYFLIFSDNLCNSVTLICLQKLFLIFFNFPVDKPFFICYYNLNKNKYKNNR